MSRAYTISGVVLIIFFWENTISVTMEVQQVNVFVPKTEPEKTATVKITSLIMVSMLNVSNVLTDVHNVLTAILAKLVLAIEYLTAKMNVIVQQDGMKFVVIKMV